MRCQKAQRATSWLSTTPKGHCKVSYMAASVHPEIVGVLGDNTNHDATSEVGAVREAVVSGTATAGNTAGDSTPDQMVAAANRITGALDPITAMVAAILFSDTATAKKLSAV